MITFYTYPGPNDRKARIMLEEVNAEYTVQTVDIKKSEQFHPDFLKISPNNKVPAIVDNTADGPVSVFETGAILIYLAEKSGQMLARSGAVRADTLAWLFWGTGSLGGTLPQLHYYVDLPESVPGTVERFAREAGRLFRVLETRLEQSEYITGDYSIADIPAYCSTSGWLARVKGIPAAELGDTPAIDRWLKAISERPAVQRVK